MSPLLSRLPMPRLLFRLSMLRGWIPAFAGMTMLAVAAVAVLTSAYPAYAESGACASGGAVADCDALLAAKANLSGGAVLSWSAELSMEEWDGVTVTDPEDAGPGEEAPLGVIVLDLDAMGLSGEIPSELTALERLQLGHNEFSGPVPAWIVGLTSVEWLDLRNNRFTGEVPAWIGDLTTLRDRHLEYNHLTGAVPPEIGNLAALRHIHLEHNRLTGNIPRELGLLTELR